MNVSESIGALNPVLKPEKVGSGESVSNIKHLYTQKLTKDEAEGLRAEIAKNTAAFTFNSTALQSGTLNADDQFAQSYRDFQSFLQDVGYEGKPIAQLSQDEAAELVSEDGFFGINKTSQRIADFVINGAGGDEDLLRAGREGVLQGFKMAEEIWGGKLPEISQTTMAKTIEMIDMAMNDLGFSILNKEV
ncbi:hypothetical protein KJ877_08825 [bacterium]|nr:hypothetical protein [bacterium]MBU1990800.1 hypothetical protein [bacterium]